MYKNGIISVSYTHLVSAVEMEGAAMAQTAYLNEIPYVVLRAISDKADGSADLSYEEFLPIAAKNASSRCV